MKRNLLSILLTALLMLVGQSLWAYDAKIDGIYYNFSGTEATVTYQRVKDLGNSNYTIESDYSGNVTIPSAVTYNDKTYSVTNIDNYAFMFCTGLKGVTIPNSVTSIGGAAFYGCTGLKGVTIPNSVTSIGGSAFSGCSGLTNVTIGTGVTDINNGVFSNCTGLTSITIPSSVSTIGENAFQSCTGMTNVAIGNNVTSIGSGAFSYCSGLTSIEIPNSVMSINGSAFNSCTGLTSIVVASGNSVYDSRNGCNAIIETASNTLIVGCSTVLPQKTLNENQRKWNKIMKR